jgi:hypothetical protein
VKHLGLQPGSLDLEPCSPNLGHAALDMECAQKAGPHARLIQKAAIPRRNQKRAANPPNPHSELMTCDLIGGKDYPLLHKQNMT